LTTKPKALKTTLIVQHWDDLLRVAGSLKMGTVRASELIRSLQRGSRASTLGRAIGELFSQLAVGFQNHLKRVFQVLASFIDAVDLF
jgi:hypothetical protein